MNRAERRKRGIKVPPPRMKHITQEAYDKELDKAYRKGIDVASNFAVVYMLGVPLLVLQEKFNEVRLKEFDGKSRIEHFFDLCVEMYERYNEGEDTLDRLMSDVKEHTGLDIVLKVINEQDRKEKK
jgi:hypothetical protein